MKPTCLTYRHRYGYNKTDRISNNETGHTVAELFHQQLWITSFQNRYDKQAKSDITLGSAELAKSMTESVQRPLNTENVDSIQQSSETIDNHYINNGGGLLGRLSIFGYWNYRSKEAIFDSLKQRAEANEDGASQKTLEQLQLKLDK